MNKEENVEKVGTVNTVEITKPDLSDIDKDTIRRICKNEEYTIQGKLDILTDHFKVELDVIKIWLESLNIVLYPTQFSAAKLHTLKKKKRYIISSAQNASPVNISFLNNIKAYAKFIDAEIGIIVSRYKNPTSIWCEGRDVWAKEVQKYKQLVLVQLVELSYLEDMHLVLLVILK